MVCSIFMDEINVLENYSQSGAVPEDTNIRMVLIANLLFLFLLEAVEILSMHASITNPLKIDLRQLTPHTCPPNLISNNGKINRGGK